MKKIEFEGEYMETELSKEDFVDFVLRKIDTIRELQTEMRDTCEDLQEYIDKILEIEGNE